MDRFKTPARGLLAAAIVVSFAFAWMTPAVEAPDSGGYLNPARSWAAGNGLREGDGSPLSYRMPVYPLLLGTNFRLFGDSSRTTTMLNVALLLAAALLMRDVARRQGSGALGDVVAAVTLLYPPFLTSTALVLQEVLLAFQVALLLWLLLRAVDKPVAATALAAGFAFAFAALGKPTILMAAPFLLIAFTTGPLKLRRGAAFIVGAALLLGAWGARNAVELGRFELAPGNAGHTFLGGTVANDIDGWFTFPEYTAAVADWNRLPVSERTTLDRFLGMTGFAAMLRDHPST